MLTMKVDAHLSIDDLVKAAEHLSLSDLETLTTQVLALSEQRKAPGLSANEADLLLKINQGLSDDLQKRYTELVVARKIETLIEAEHAELKSLTNQVEQQNAKRTAYLSDLACLRETSLTALLEDLGIQTAHIEL